MHTFGGSFHCFWGCSLFLELHARCCWTAFSLLQITQFGWQLHISVAADGLLDFNPSMWQQFHGIYVCIFCGLQTCIHVVVSFCWTVQTTTMNPSRLLSFYSPVSLVCHGAQCSSASFSIPRMRCFLPCVSVLCHFLASWPVLLALIMASSSSILSGWKLEGFDWSLLMLCLWSCWVIVFGEVLTLKM